MGSWGLRIGTYRMGRCCRNPHVADALIAAALARGGPARELAPLDDQQEWDAHRVACKRIRRSSDAGRRTPRWARGLVDPLRNLVGF